MADPWLSEVQELLDQHTTLLAFFYLGIAGSATRLLESYEKLINKISEREQVGE